MNSETLNNWMQFLASVGVILSLIFVGVQVKQSREIAIADIYGRLSVAGPRTVSAC